MLESKSMATPMDTNLKLLADESSDLVDVTQYRQIIGLLMYMTNNRTNICFGVNTLSQYLVKPRCVHLVATKHVMRYLKCTIGFGLYYVGDHDYKYYGYTDALVQKCLRQEEHLRWMLLFGIHHDLMIQQETVQCCSQHS